MLFYHQNLSDSLSIISLDTIKHLFANYSVGLLAASTQVGVELRQGLGRGAIHNEGRERVTKRAPSRSILSFVHF